MLLLQGFCPMLEATTSVLVVGLGLLHTDRLYLATLFFFNLFSLRILVLSC